MTVTRVTLERSMALSNAERQRRFRERRIKSGEQVRLEFRVSKRQADTFKALASRWC